MVSQASEDIARGDAAKGLEPAVPDPSIARPVAPPAGSPLFVAGGALTPDMVQMLNDGWSPAILVPSEPYSADAPDYKGGFGADGTLSGYQQRLIDAGIMRQTGPGQTMSGNSTGPAATFYPLAKQTQAQPAPLQTPASNGDATAEATMTPPAPAAPAPATPTAADAVAPAATETPMAARQVDIVALASPVDASALADEMLQVWVQGIIAARADLAQQGRSRALPGAAEALDRRAPALTPNPLPLRWARETRSSPSPARREKGSGDEGRMRVRLPPWASGPTIATMYRRLETSAGA